MQLRARLHRPVFGSRGREVIFGACGYEIVALISPLPTISELVKRHPTLGVTILLLLAHHWYLEECAPQILVVENLEVSL